MDFTAAGETETHAIHSAPYEVLEGPIRLEGLKGHLVAVHEAYPKSSLFVGVCAPPPGVALARDFAI